MPDESTVWVQRDLGVTCSLAQGTEASPAFLGFCSLGSPPPLAMPTRGKASPCALQLIKGCLLLGTHGQGDGVAQPSCIPALGTSAGPCARLRSLHGAQRWPGSSIHRGPMAGRTRVFREAHTKCLLPFQRLLLALLCAFWGEVPSWLLLGGPLSPPCLGFPLTWQPCCEPARHTKCPLCCVVAAASGGHGALVRSQGNRRAPSSEAARPQADARWKNHPIVRRARPLHGALQSFFLAKPLRPKEKRRAVTHPRLLCEKQKWAQSEARRQGHTWPEPDLTS